MISSPKVSETGREVYPLLPLRDIVIFPHMVTPLFVGRPRSIHALEYAMEQDKLIFLVTQFDPKKDDPELEDVYPVGTLGQIIQMLKLPDGTVKVLIEGQQRGRVIDFISEESQLKTEVELIEEPLTSTPETEALLRSVVDAFENYVNLGKRCRLRC